MEHVRVAVYDITSGDFTDVAAKAEQGMLPTFQRMPGFVSYGLAQTGPTTCISLSVWQSREQAEAAVGAAADWVRDNLAGQIRLRDNYVGDFGFHARGPVHA